MSSKNETETATGKTGSIAARLTFWYALFSVVLIALSGSVLYWVLANQLSREDDRLLTGKIAEMRAVLLLHPNDYAALREEIQHETTTFRGIYIRVLDKQGQVVAASPAFNAADGLFTAQFPVEERGRDWNAGDERKYRVLSGTFDINKVVPRLCRGTHKGPVERGLPGLYRIGDGRVRSSIPYGGGTLLFLARTEQPAAYLDRPLLGLEQEIATVCAFYQAIADEQGINMVARSTGNVFPDSGLAACTGQSRR